MQRLSTGLKVQSAADDPSGSSQALKLRAQSSGMAVAMNNVADGLNIAHYAEGVMADVGDMILEMRNTVLHSLNNTASDDLRDEMDTGLAVMTAGVREALQGAKLDNFELFNTDQSIDLMVGADVDDTFSLSVHGMLSGVMSLLSGLDIGEGPNHKVNTKTALNHIDKAIDLILEERLHLGSSANSLDRIVSQLQEKIDITQSKHSQIINADYAREASSLARADMLRQTTITMLAKANKSTYSLLPLLQ